MEIIVCIRKKEEFSFGGPLSCIPCGPKSFISLMNDSGTGVALGKRIAKRSRSVSRSVINEDNIKILIGLSFNGFQTAKKVLLNVVNGNDDTNQRLLSFVFLYAQRIIHSVDIAR